MKYFSLYLIGLFTCSLFSCTSDPTKGVDTTDRVEYYSDSRPWARWWWFASEIQEDDVVENLQWLKENGFGGVEIAWVYPLNRMLGDTINYTPRQAWLSSEWSEIVAFAKHSADSMGLGCDFTFGSLWPFGDADVTFAEATQRLTDSLWRQQIRASWEYPVKGLVVDHLSKTAFLNYARRTGEGLKPALAGSRSALFCDSWEVQTRFLTTAGFLKQFEVIYGYSLTPLIDSLYANSGNFPKVRYDYMKLISRMVRDSFFSPFTEYAHSVGAFSRVQCMGAPADMLDAYSLADVPESEALLYEPAYSVIPASAAALSGKRIVTAESFTCLYGWPSDYLAEEQTADLKLLADAIFANGVNHIVWHGKPMNPAGYDTVKFYASVHLGKARSLAAELPDFNAYLQKVSAFMKKGVSYSDVAVYLPLEDAWIAGELPRHEQLRWAWGYYELRHLKLPDELSPYRPLWINPTFLQKAKLENGLLKVGDCAFRALYVDVEYMDVEGLKSIISLAQSGFPVCLKRLPTYPSAKEESGYAPLLHQVETLIAQGRISTEWTKAAPLPLVVGDSIPEFWCRQSGKDLYIFFANPKTKAIHFPLEYGQSLQTDTIQYDIMLNYAGKSNTVKLNFYPYQSILLCISPNGKVKHIDITFLPQSPVYEPRIKPERERWAAE